jgi:Zn-dependent protease with chaperone function
MAGLAYGYFRGIPIAARWLAQATPAALQRRMGDEILALLDQKFLAPSVLDGARRDALSVRFAGASLRSAPLHFVRLEFRSLRLEEPQPEEDPGESDEPAYRAATINAFSLPGGTVIVLDGLVEAADRDEVFAVLGHELGHVVHDHSMRHLLQSAGVAALAGLVWGDFSGVAASVPATLGLLRYSRDVEREADDFAVRFLVEHGLDAGPLCRFFDLILELEGDIGYADIPEFLSTHPDTGDRMERICPEDSAS